MFFTLATWAGALSVISGAAAATIDVVVGGPGILKYDPEFVTAKQGDQIIFHFKQKNHTATQSTLANPCNKKDGGFDSGFVPVPDTNTDGPFPVAQYTVTDTDPVWVYCGQPGHCTAGMVFAINPGDKFDAFKSTATSGAAASSSAPAATSTGAAAPKSTSTTDHRVIVGGPGLLTFQPSNITAIAGDTVTFEFRQKNHTVTQSTFAAPCRALASTSTTNQVSFDSGFMAVADGETNFPTWTVQINDTTPVWAYCRQANHCGSGMVFSVNSVETGPNNFGAFKAKAMQLNGTGAGAAPATPTNGASSLHLGAAGFVSSIGLLLGLML